MTVIATALKYLIEAGVTGDVLVTAIAEIEASLNEPRARSSGAERTRRWREKKAEQASHVTSQASQSVTVTSQASQPSQEPGVIYNTTRAHAFIPVGLSNDNPNSLPPYSPPPTQIAEDEATAPRKASRATKSKPRTAIFETSQPTDADRDAATKAGLQPEEFRDQWRAFRDYHIGRGSRMADWSAAWRTWLGNMRRFANSRSPPTKTNGYASLLAEITGLNDGKPRESRDFAENVRLLPISEGGRRGGEIEDGDLSGGPVALLVGNAIRRM